MNPGYPDRLVDADDQGWVLIDSGNGTYQSDPPVPGLTYAPYLQIVDEFGPSRPVLPITDHDAELLRSTLVGCGRHAVATLAAALESVFHELKTIDGGTRPHERALMTMTAGGYGSNESSCLMPVIAFGADLNVQPVKHGGDVSAHARRAAGPTSRVVRPARDVLTTMFLRWVTGPDRYTELASTLAVHVSLLADCYGPQGWNKFSDAWLRPTSVDPRNFTVCYRLLYSQSRHIDLNLL